MANVEEHPPIDGFRVGSLVVRGVRYIMRELTTGQVEQLSELPTEVKQGVGMVAAAMADTHGKRLYADLEAGMAGIRELPSGVTEELQPLLAYVQNSAEDPEGN